MDFFPGFRRQTIETSGTSINVVTGGSGPPLLLLHGYPQTHIEWRKMAPDLSANHTLVMPDLRATATAASRRPATTISIIQSVPWRSTRSR